MAPSLHPSRPGRRPLLLLAALLLAGLVVAVVRPAPAAALDPGTNAVVRADGDCLNLRAQPSLQGTLITCIPEGATVAVLDGAVDADGYRWQRIAYRSQSGWAVEQYLRAAPSSPGVPPPAQPTPVPPPELSGNVPTDGFGLVVWSGGHIDRIPPLAATRGCGLRAVWVTRDGDFIGYVYGAPAVVNVRWNETFPSGSLPPNSPIIVVCAPGTPLPPPPPPSPSGPVTVPALPPGIPNTPPGPAGNG